MLALRKLGTTVWMSKLFSAYMGGFCYNCDKMQGETVQGALVIDVEPWVSLFGSLDASLCMTTF